MTPEELKRPPTDVEIAEILYSVRGVPRVADLLRRLVYQRDQLVIELAQAKKDQMFLHRWENSSEQPDLLILARDEDHANEIAAEAVNQGHLSSADYTIVQHLRPVQYREATLIFAEDVISVAKETV